MKRPLLALTAAALMTGAALPAAYAVAAPRGSAAASLSAEDRAVVNAASSYLQNLTTARGRFVQTDPNGAVSQGTFYLKRPGKVRFEYDAPSRLLVVADGSNINISDPRLKTFRQYPQGKTPLSLFLGQTINLDRGSISRVNRSGDSFSITARDSRRQAEGDITLTFSNSPVQLREWTVTDPQRRQTRVRVTSLTPVGALDNSLFTLRNPNRRTGPR